jgi:hypothetical protein
MIIVRQSVICYEIACIALTQNDDNMMEYDHKLINGHPFGPTLTSVLRWVLLTVLNHQKCVDWAFLYAEEKQTYFS